MSVTAPDSTGTSLAPHVEVEGSPVPTAVTDALVELRVLLGVGTVGRCTVRLAAPGFALATSSPFAIGRRVTVSARGLEHGAVRLRHLDGHTDPPVVAGPVRQPHPRPFRAGSRPMRS